MRGKGPLLMPSYIRRKSGQWAVRWRVRNPAPGQPAQPQQGGFRTRAEARDWYEHNVAGKRITPSGTLTMATYLARWLDGHAVSVEAGTIRTYGFAIRQFVEMHGHVRLRDLEPDHIRAWHADALERGYAPNTITSWNMVLAAALNQAVRDEIITASPTRHATPPRPASTPPPHWTHDEIRRFLDGCPADLRGMVYRFALMTGIRPGEIAALEWPQVDLESGVVSIEQTTTLDDANRIVTGPPKTASSYRRVIMPDALRQEMRAYRRLWLEARLLSGAAWDQGHEYVFPGRYGRRADTKTWRTRLRRLCAALAIRPLSLHGLRHSWATWMLGLREHPAIVGAQLGHKSISTTIDTYSHVSEDMQREAAARLDEDLRRHGA